MSGWRTWAWTAAKICFVVAVLTWLMLSGQFSTKALSVGAAGLPLLAAGLSLLGVVMALGFLRWWILARTAGLDLGLTDAFRLALAGAFANNFLFGSYGGDAVKFAFLANHGASRAPALASMALDRWCGLVGLVAVSLLTICLQWEVFISHPGTGDVMRLARMAAVVVLAGGVFLLVALPFMLQRLSATDGRLGRLAAAFSRCRSRPFPLLAALGLSTLLFALNILAFFLLAASSDEGHALTPGLFFLAAPPAFLANTIPSPGGGLGIGEAAFGQSLSLCAKAAGTTVKTGASYFLLLRFWTMVLSLAGLPFFLFMRNKTSSNKLQP